MLGCIQLGGGDRQALSLPRVRGIRGCPFAAHGEPVDLDSLTWPSGSSKTGPHMNAHDLAAEIKRFNGGTSPQDALVWKRNRTGWCAARDDMHYRPLWEDAKSTTTLKNDTRHVFWGDLHSAELVQPEETRTPYYASCFNLMVPRRHILQVAC